MPESKSHRYTWLLRILVTFFVTFDFAFVSQRLMGAYASEFGAHPDEAAHCVTGLFVRDAIAKGWEYASGGFQGSPVEVGREFASNFYRHYPKVALGVWPPAFHTAQAVWTFPFGASRFSLLLLMAALAAATATLLFEVIYRQHGWWAASIGAVIWLCGPLVREYTGLIMAEMMSALTMFAAALVWARYLEHGRARHAIGFALLASLAILTKGTGVALILMCGLTALVSRKWRIFAQPSLWAAALIVVVLAGIWTWIFRHEGTRVGGWEEQSFQWAFTGRAIGFYLKTVALSLAIAVAFFACIGFVARARRDTTALTLGLLVISIFVFQSLVPAGREERHMLAATPALVVLAVFGAFAVARHPSARVADAAAQRRREFMWVLLLALLSLPQALLAAPQKSYGGFGPLAVKVLREAPPGARILICSDASGEGMFISELALRDDRPNFIVERGSKSLVEAKGRDWAGRNLRPRFSDQDALLNYVLRSDIQFVVLDAAIPDEKRAAYHDQFRRMVEENVGTFWPIAESPVHRKGEDLFPPLRLYRVVREPLRGIPPPVVR